MNIEEELGTYIIDVEVSDKIRKYFNRKNFSSNLEKTAKIALRRFPELQAGERISVKEIKERLKEIKFLGKSLGYKIKLYSKMNRKEAWDYLIEIKRDVRKLAKRYCPGVLSEIDKANKQSIEDSINII